MHCVECQKFIEFPRGRQKTCSPTCSRKRNSRLVREQRGIVDIFGNCTVCQAPFKTFRKFKKTCSSECRRIYSKSKAQEAIKKHWAKIILGEFKDAPKRLISRFEILKRDNFKCTYCGYGAKDGRKLHVDHIIPRSQGGTDSFENLTTSCQECNLGKRDRFLDDKISG